MHLVFLGAHPDDETYASGTIAKHVEGGGKATIVVATRGGKGHWRIPPEDLCKLRTQEMEKAAKILGAGLVWLDFEDASVPESDELRETLVDIFRRLKPDIVITFHPLVWRDDHRRVGLAASDATLKASLPLHRTNHPYHRPEPEVYFFGEPMTPIAPDAYVDVTNQMETKRRAFACHATQWTSWETDGPPDSDNAEKIWSRFKKRFAANGVLNGIDYAEAYISREKTRKRHGFFQPKLDKSFTGNPRILQRSPTCQEWTR
jgi:LmbE family N-acetylglucosaminyl deacetylase